MSSSASCTACRFFQVCADEQNRMFTSKSNIFPKRFSTAHSKLTISILDNISVDDEKIATRKASQKCLEFLCEELPEMIGGSADLTGSNNTMSRSNTEFLPSNPEGTHIYYGVREFGMTGITNGMILHGGIKPYSGTFLVFMDYGRNAVRMSSLM